MIEEKRIKKILIIGPTDPTGGVGQVIKNLCTGMERSKIQFDFLYYEKPTEAAKEYIYNLNSKYFVVPRYSEHPFRFLKKIIKIYKENRYDGIHIHASTAMLIMYAMPVLLCNDTKIIYHSHLDYAKPVWLHKVMKKIVCRVCDYYIAVSKQAGKWMYNDKIMSSNSFILLNNGIDVKKYLFDEKKRQDIRNDLGIRDEFVIGHIGRFVEQKNHEFIIEIFNIIHKMNQNTKLLLIGDGPLVKDMKNKVSKLELSDAVIFYGVSSKVQDLLQVMDVFLFPSKWEGLGIVAVEAQASGLPVLASDHVPEEAKILDSFQYISLDESALYWAHKTLACKKNLERENCLVEITNAGYDLENSINKLFSIYETI